MRVRVRVRVAERDVQRVGGEAGERRGEVDAVHALAHALREPPHAHRLVEGGRGDERVHAALGHDQRGHLSVGVRVRVRVRASYQPGCRSVRRCPYNPNPNPYLVAAERGDPHVEEDAVQHGHGDLAHRLVRG